MLPKPLLERIQRWEFVDFSNLLPAPSIFGCELLRPTKREISFVHGILKYLLLTFMLGLTVADEETKGLSTCLTVLDISVYLGHSNDDVPCCSYTGHCGMLDGQHFVHICTMILILTAFKTGTLKYPREAKCFKGGKMLPAPLKETLHGKWTCGFQSEGPASQMSL